MSHEEFVAEVQSRARIHSREEAERIIRITLETLGERIDHSLADNIGAQLPPTIGRWLRTDVPFERVTLDQFYRRVKSRENDGMRAAVELPEATRHARAVVEVVYESLTMGAAEKFRLGFPAGWEPLFDSFGDERRYDRDESRQQPRALGF
jgi:uncharacterized protein (DUF2267 family)